MNIHYVLDDNHNVVPEPDVMRWAEAFEHDRRIVRQQHVGLVFVSTVFLGLDHRFGGEGPPIVFESMTFPGERAERCSTWEQALAMHSRACRAARSPKLQLIAVWERISFSKWRRRRQLQKFVHKLPPITPENQSE